MAQTVINDKPILDIYRKAREAITPEGMWTQHTRLNSDGAMCALGALDFAAHGNANHFNDDSNLLQPLFDCLVQRGFPAANYGISPSNDMGWTIANYNNSHTQAEVLDVFDCAIKALEA